MDDGVEFWSAMDLWTVWRLLPATTKFSTISKRMKTFLLLPHSNADTECVFSMVNKICTEHRADLAQDTVVALLWRWIRVWIRCDSNHPEMNLAKENPPRWNTIVCICTLHDVTYSFVEPSLDELNSQREIRHHRISPFTLILQTAICLLVII